MQVQLPSRTIGVGRTTLGPFTVNANWSACNLAIDFSQAVVFPIWITGEISRDNGATWELLIRFDVTGFAETNKFTGLPSDKVLRFSRRTIKSTYRKALVRVHVDSPAAFTVSGGTVDIDDSGLVIPPHSSIALVSGQAIAADTADVGGGTLATGNFASAVTAGNLIVANSGNDSRLGYTTTAVADTPGNTYTVNQVSANNTTAEQRIDGHYAKNIAGGTCSVTATFSNADTRWRHIHASEFSGADTTAPLDQSLGGTGNGTPSSGSVTTTTDGQLIYGADGHQSTGTGAGFTGLALGGDYNNRSEYQIQTSAGSIAATFTGSGQYEVVVMTFKAASAGRTTKNTRAWTLGVNVGMGHRMPV